MAFVIIMAVISIALMIASIAFNRQAFNQKQTTKSKALIAVTLLVGALSILFAGTLIINIFRNGG